MSDRDVASAPTPAGAPTPGVEPPTREVTVDPVGEPSRWAIAMEDAESIIGDSRTRWSPGSAIRAQQATVVSLLALNHMLHRLTLAIESGVVQLGEIACGVQSMVEVEPIDPAGKGDDDGAPR